MSKCASRSRNQVLNGSSHNITPLSIISFAAEIKAPHPSKKRGLLLFSRADSKSLQPEHSLLLQEEPGSWLGLCPDGQQLLYPFRLSAEGLF